MSTNALGRQARNLKNEGRRLARKATTSQLIETLTRLGYMARGLVYLVIGVLALQVALGVGGALTDPQGAIAAMGRTPVGDVLLFVILIGLIGYSVWGVIRAVFDPLHKGNDLKGSIARLGYFVSAIFYGLLALGTYGLITGVTTTASGGQSAQTQQTTASIMSNSWGPWVVALAGVIVILAGLVQIGQSLNQGFGKQFRPYALNSTQERWIDRLGRFGTAARGLVFVLIGIFLVLAGYYKDPSLAKGIGGVLAILLQQPYGRWLLGLVALGLIAFGFYSAISGYWLRVRR